MRFTGAGLSLAGVDTGPIERGAIERIVCFSHGLLFSHRMFGPQIAALRDRFRVVAWDHRGQGDSDVPPGRVATIEACTDDAIAVIERLGAPVDFVGLSMGGFVGLRIAARRPELVRSLVLIATAPDPEPPENVSKYRRLNLAARLFGVTGWLAARVMPIMTSSALASDPSAAERMAEIERQLRSNRRTIYKAVNGVLEREGCEELLGAIRAPTVVLRGADDRAIALDRANKLVRGIAGARFVEIPRAGHSASLEQPEAVTRLLLEHLR